MSEPPTDSGGLQRNAEAKVLFSVSPLCLRDQWQPFVCV